MVSGTEGNIDDSLIGGSASAEGLEGKGTKNTVITGDIVMNHHGLQNKSNTSSLIKKNYQFFIGEKMNPDGMVALLDQCEGGVTPYMIFFKAGLEMEK
ncbi:hypothetical protein MC885_005930, partial [Smutsia gigantea]